MDRDYWKDKHRPGWDQPAGKKPDLSPLQTPRQRGTPLWIMILVWLLVAAVLFFVFAMFDIPGRATRPSPPTIERTDKLVVLHVAALPSIG